MESFKQLASQLESILDHLPVLVFLKDVNNKFLYVNKYVADAYLRKKEDLIGLDLYDLYPHDIAQRYHRDDLEVIQSGKPKLNFEEEWETIEGRQWVQTSKLPYRNDEGEIIGIVGFSQDVTVKKESDRLIQELLQRLQFEKASAERDSITDRLTKLKNRRCFDCRYFEEYMLHKRNGNILSVIFIDIDDFKGYNDFYGHLAGDKCLKKVGYGIESSLSRPTDMAFRYGGEEFLVILPNTCNDGAVEMGNRIRKNIEMSLIENSTSPIGEYVTVSLGVYSGIPNNDVTQDFMLRQADIALYQAKTEGKNRVVNSSLSLTEADCNNSVVSIKWTRQLASGNLEIDRQHRELFKIANKIFALISSDKNDSLLSELRKLKDKIASHFFKEEIILAERNYPFVDQHREIHKKLIQDYDKILLDISSDSKLNYEFITFFVAEVVKDHFEKEDRKFFDFIQ